MTMVSINIDGADYQVEEGLSLLQAVQTIGLDLPYFCWHPALGSVGACRQCAVIQFNDEKDDKGKLVMACMVGVSDGMRVSIAADRAVKFRAAVIEWLMTNHPHDCPVCDEGGECHLQDMTVMSGHNYRRFRFKKRTFRNQELGPFIQHEMNRCITCYRCVRFYNDIAGGEDLQAIGGHNHVYFGRLSDGVLENEFSGNLVEVCPTGVFTDKTLRHHYARKWDLQSAPSVCHHCSLGCNTLVGSRYDKAVRVLNRYNSDVNGYFICDRGRFGYEFTNSDTRIVGARIGKVGGDAVSSEDAVRRAAEIITESQRVIGIGSPRASLESNYALKKLVGEDNFSCGMSAPESELTKSIISILTSGPVKAASLKDIRESDAVVILGEDILQSAPMMALSVRQAIRNKPMKLADMVGIDRWNDYAVREVIQDEKGPLFIANPTPTRLDTIATACYRSAPADIARLGFAVASQIENAAPAPDDITDDVSEPARKIADAFADADHPVVIAGTGLADKAIVEAAANIAFALHGKGKDVKLAYVLPECNAMGAALVGGMDLDTALERIRREPVDAVVVLENNIYRRCPRKDIDDALDKTKQVIALDCIHHEGTDRADLVLPVTTYAEGSGTLISNEGRAQRFFRAFVPDPAIRESWRWCAHMIDSRQAGLAGWENLDDISRELFDSMELSKGKYPASWSHAYRIDGVRIARSPHRYSGRTAMRADQTIHEPPPPVDTDAPLTFSMEGYQGRPPGPMTPFYWAPGWNSVQSLNHYQKEVGQELRGGDPGIRLIAPNEAAQVEYFGEIPDRFHPRGDELLLVPNFHIFGSDELSRRAQGIRSLMPEPYIAIGGKEAEKRRLADGDTVTVKLSGVEVKLPVMIVASIPDGIAALPAGFRQIQGMVLPGFGNLERGGE